MGDLIDMRIPFHLRRLQADVRRAERDYNGFHDNFERYLSSLSDENRKLFTPVVSPLWGTSVFEMVNHVENQRRLNEAMQGIILPPKPEED